MRKGCVVLQGFDPGAETRAGSVQSRSWAGECLGGKCVFSKEKAAQENMWEEQTCSEDVA